MKKKNIKLYGYMDFYEDVYFLVCMVFYGVYSVVENWKNCY